MRSFKPTSMPRRDWLAGSLSAVALAGCRSEPEDAGESAAQPVRSDVPLRVLWVGEADDSEVLQRAWALVSEQPLDLRVVPPPRHILAASEDSSAIAPEQFGRDLVQQASTADVLCYPLAMMSELVAEKRLMPLLEESPASPTPDNARESTPDVFAGGERESLPVALRVATSYAGQRLAEPLGGYLPALLLNQEESETKIRTWDEYESFVQSSDGKCCEPSAPAWAASTYLWRLASSLTATWLFEHESLHPLLNSPEYVAVLEQMARSVQQSVHADAGLSPSEIYDAVTAGTLRGGIGFPQSPPDQFAETEVTFAALPAGRQRVRSDALSTGHRLDPRRGMVDPFMLVGSLAASCRQTAAAKLFLDWIVDGDGSERLYRDIGSMLDTTSSTKGASGDPVQRYREWDIARLDHAGFVTTLRIPGAIEYYQALDQGVRACVHGGQDAKQVCDEITDQWMHLHRKYDLPSQRRAWRRAQEF